MRKETIHDGALSVTIPDGFRPFKARDLEDEWAVKDAEKHLIFNVGWSRIPLLARGTSIEKVVKNTEPMIARKVPTFEKTAEARRIIDGKDAFGFRYNYTAESIEMTAEYLLMKVDKEYYVFSLLGRRNTFDSLMTVFEEILKSIEFR